MNRHIDIREHINLLAEIELKGRIAAGVVDFDCEEDGRYPRYDYDLQSIIDAVVEDLAQVVDYESPTYNLICDIIEERVNEDIDEEMLDEIAVSEAREAMEEAHEQYLLRKDYLEQVYAG